jgi:hypothetical protein
MILFITFLVIEETAALRISDKEIKSNPNSEKSKTASGKNTKIISVVLDVSRVFLFEPIFYIFWYEKYIKLT